MKQYTDSQLDYNEYNASGLYERGRTPEPTEQEKKQRAWATKSAAKVVAIKKHITTLEDRNKNMTPDQANYRINENKIKALEACATALAPTSNDESTLEQLKNTLASFKLGDFSYEKNTGFFGFSDTTKSYVVETMALLQEREALLLEEKSASALSHMSPRYDDDRGMSAALLGAK